MDNENSPLNINLCIPKKLDDYSTIHLELIEKLKKIHTDKKIVNSIFYGKEGTGKYTVVLSLLATLYGDSIFNIKTIDYPILDEVTKKNLFLRVKASKFHYEIDMRNYYTSESDIINMFLNTITNSTNVETNSYHIIIIKNVQYMKINNQERIKSCLEKNFKNCRIIFITNEITKVDPNLSSRCMQFRIPKISKYETAILTLQIIHKNNINITSSQLQEIVEDSNNNLNILKFILINIIISGKYTKYSNKYKDIILKIPIIIKKKKINIFNEIRELLLNLLVCNVQPDFIFYTLLDSYMDTNIPELTKRQILDKCTIFQNNCQMGYRQLYHIEAFISSIVVLLNNI